MEIEEKASDYLVEDSGLDFEKPLNDQVEEKEKSRSGNKVIDILKSKTGTGTIEDYKEHPLNFNQNKYLGQIIRGLTGVCGSLDLAIIDIILGTLGLIKDKNATV